MNFNDCNDLAHEVYESMDLDAVYDFVTSHLIDSYMNDYELYDKDYEYLYGDINE